MGSTKLPSRNPTGYLGLKETNPPQLYFEHRPPTSEDARGYDAGDIWIDITSDNAYILIKRIGNFAVWLNFGTTPGVLGKLTGDAGGPVNPDTSDNINLLGTSSQGISTLGTPGTNTITWTIADATETQKGVLETSTNAETINGSANNKAVVPSSLAAKLGAQTQYGIPYGQGATNAINWTSALQDGELVIGDSGNAPKINTLTAGGGITIVNGAGTITISGTGGGMGWTEITTTSVSMNPDSGYVLNNVALVTATLPATIAFGQKIHVIGKGTGGWTIAQNAGQSIRFGDKTTTIGAGGSLSSFDHNDSLSLLCITANTEFAVMAPIGNITMI